MIFWKNKVDIILKEKEELSICFEKTKNDFDSHKRICKGKSPKIVFDQNEFESLKNRIDVLDVSLKKCAFHMKKTISCF